MTLGIHLTLLGAIQKYMTSYKLVVNYLLTSYRSLILDQRDIDQFKVREKYGISHSYRSSSITSRYHDHLRREDILTSYKLVLDGC